MQSNLISGKKCFHLNSFVVPFLFIVFVFPSQLKAAIKFFIEAIFLKKEAFSCDGLEFLLKKQDFRVS